MPDWSATQYLKFEDQRTRPARDLLAQVPHDTPRRVVDIGCGPGNSTQLLCERWPDAEVIGIDSSPDMLEKARARLPGVRFDLANARDWVPEEPVDVIFANAVFQWLPDHVDVFRRLVESLAPGGVLAVQMPDNIAEPSHASMGIAAEDSGLSRQIGNEQRDALPPVADYYNALAGMSAYVDIWHTHYTHPLESAGAIAEWFKSTGLKPFLDPLDPEEQERFLAAYLKRIEAAYPPANDGKVLLRFPRLFIVAVRGV